MPPIQTHDRLKPEAMISMLKQALPPANLALLRLVAQEAEARSLPLYIIGGFVRDLFIGKPGLDFDLVVEGEAQVFARHVSGKFGGKVTIHPQFGTATWQPALEKLARVGVDSFSAGEVQPLDFVTARSETYTHPGALPTVKAGSLEDDLRRRDFTINTLALRLDGEYFGQLYDLLGGLQDIEKGVVRVLHTESYLDDPTRIMRAVRYEQRYSFNITPKDLMLIEAARSGVEALSGERLRHELDLMLAEERSAAMLARLHELRILDEALPLLPWEVDLLDLPGELNQPEPAYWKDVPDLLHVPRRVGLGYLVWLGRLEEWQVFSLAARLDFAASLRDALVALSGLTKHLPGLAGASPSRVVEQLEGVPLLALCAAWIRSRGPEKQLLASYLERWRYIRPHTDGNNLIRRGLEPGPAFKVILQRLRSAWLDGEIKSQEEETRLLDELINQMGNP